MGFEHSMHLNSDPLLVMATLKLVRHALDYMVIKKSLIHYYKLYTIKPDSYLFD